MMIRSQSNEFSELTRTTERSNLFLLKQEVETLINRVVNRHTLTMLLKKSFDEELLQF